MAKHYLGKGSIYNQLYYISHMLLLIGLNVFDGNWMTGWKIMRDGLLLALNVLMLTFIVTGYFFNAVSNTGQSMFNCVLSLVHMSDGLTDVLQLFWIIYFREDLRKFIDIAYLGIEQQKSDEEKEAYSKSMGFNKMISITAMTLFFLTQIGIIFFISSDTSGVIVPFVIVIDWETIKESPNYEIIVTTMIIIGGAFIILARCVYLLIYITLLGHCSSQYRVLGIRIKNIVQKMQERRAEIIDCESMMDEMKFTIDSHCLIILMISRIKNIYQIIVLAIFVKVMALIVTTLLLRKPILLSNLVIQVFSIFIFACVSEILNTERENFFHFVYSTDWYLASVNNRKCICFIMLMASKPLNLTIAKLRTLSLETFFSFIKFAYSCYALVKSKSVD